MLSGLMMDYQLTIDRVLEHGNRLYPHKKIRTKLPDGTLHEYSFREFYGRVKRAVQCARGAGRGAGGPGRHVRMEQPPARGALLRRSPGAGAVVHTLNIRLFPDQLAYIINHAEDKVIFHRRYVAAADRTTCGQARRC